MNSRQNIILNALVALSLSSVALTMNPESIPLTPSKGSISAYTDYLSQDRAERFNEQLRLSRTLADLYKKELIMQDLKDSIENNLIRSFLVDIRMAIKDHDVDNFKFILNITPEELLYCIFTQVVACRMPALFGDSASYTIVCPVSNVPSEATEQLSLSSYAIECGSKEIGQLIEAFIAYFQNEYNVVTATHFSSSPAPTK
ncbi:MAG: hypothetical protein WCW33_05325 [Candidatus Babeliales bacterium]|jgi:hypothetical protein